MTDALVTPPDLARTYSPPSYADPWEVVEDYQRVLEYTGRHPNTSSQRVASALDLPRGRIRPWIDGAIPDVVRGIQTAEARDWIPLNEDSDAFDALNALTAWTCAAGSIKPDIFAVYLRVRDESERRRLEAIHDDLGLETHEYRTDNHRTTEIGAGVGGAVLGRLLVCLGVSPETGRFDTLPWYLTDVSRDAQRAFARTYLDLRGHEMPALGRWSLEHANRSDLYRRSLAGLFTSLGADADVHPDAVSVDGSFVESLTADTPPIHAD